MNPEREIVEQHRFIEGWLRGTAGPERFAEFVAAHTPDFALYGPDGSVTGLRDLAEGFAGARGTAPDLEISISGARPLAAGEGLLVAVYSEHQRTARWTGTRHSTVVFVPDPAARHGLRWRHLHETWAGP